MFLNEKKFTGIFSFIDLKPNRAFPTPVLSHPDLRVAVLSWSPSCCTLNHFGGSLLVVNKLRIYPTRLAGPVSIGASNLAVESTLEGVPSPFACDLLCLKSYVVMGVLVLYWNPYLTLWPLGDGVVVDIATTRTSASLRVVHDVHDLFFRRPPHKNSYLRKNSYLQGQARRLNRSPWNSGT